MHKLLGWGGVGMWKEPISYVALAPNKIMRKLASIISGISEDQCDFTGVIRRLLLLKIGKSIYDFHAGFVHRTLVLGYYILF